MAVNQILPSRSATSPCGPESGVFNGYSLNWPVFGSRRPNLLAVCPVYQSEPSGASAGSCGRDLGVGTSHSLMVTLGGSAVTVSATIRQIRTGAEAFRINVPPGKAWNSRLSWDYAPPWRSTQGGWRSAVFLDNLGENAYSPK